MTLLQVAELQALKQQLESEVEIPQLQPLRDDTDRLDQLLSSLQQLQVRRLPLAGGLLLHGVLVAAKLRSSACRDGVMHCTNSLHSSQAMH